VRSASLLAVGLVIVGVASAARMRSRPTADHAPRAARVDLRPEPPANVMSTLRRACFDCHSAETRWPWYSRLPIASWIIERDVAEGRGQLNFSGWTDYNPFDRADLLDEMCALTTGRRMPPLPYRLLHSDAWLSDSDVEDLCAWAEREAARLVRDGS
jgi:hypothetical protein